MTSKKTASAPRQSKPPSQRGGETAQPKDPNARVVHRRDAAGHLDPSYGRELLELGHKPPRSEATPFIEHNHTNDDFAEQLGEHTVEAATGGEERVFRDDNAPEDLLSPFRLDGQGDGQGHRTEEEEEEED
jgi:hypothetical protein